MRCMSCGANIPPEWVMAIQKNECPGCGGEIMSEPTQVLLQELTEAMERMPNDPQGVAGWLLSNYRFQKVGSGEPVEKFHRKGGGGGGQIDESQLKSDPSYSQFVKRNEATHLVQKGEQLAKLKHSPDVAEFASMIQNAGDPYGDDTISTLEVDNSPPDADEVKAYQEMKAAGQDPFAKTPVGGITDLSQAIDPNEVARYLNPNHEELSAAEKIYMRSDEGRGILERENFKKLKAQEAISTGSGGAFRR
jgi:hypothetical protein